ncbi:MAG: TIGR02680 family protein, partial [Negativicutes bacterium]|nr:TIGR02680 family protein [Negativicutes bacterium]
MNKWQMHRAGLINYWYYDEEEFCFADGRLLLRGSNGSGKSVTMQSLVTVLLDGVKTPDRLDSFGSRSRRMEDYLLGEKEILNHEERTGYLYLEYKRRQTEQYVTTGIGLNAKRSGGVDFWGFVITDNRRIKHDLWLYKREISPEDGSPVKIPLTRGELERAIGSGGQVVKSQREYMELVNRHIFGFESIEQYQELMKLLIQLRSPKLSRDFKPSVIYEILNNSLPSLSDEELRPLSDTIESMERCKLQIEQLERDSQALGRLCRQYDAYNAYILAEKADLAQKAERRRARLEREGQEQAAQLAAEQALLAGQQQRLAELERELAVLEAEKAALEQHDVFQAEKQKQEQEQQLAYVAAEKRSREEKLRERQKREREERRLAESYETQAEKRRAESEGLLRDLADAAADADFREHELLVKASGDFDHPDFDAWRQNAKHHAARLDAVRDILRRQGEARRRRDLVEQELGEERRILDEYRSEQHKLEQRLTEAREKLLADIYTWRENYGNDLPLAKEEMRLIAQTVQGLYEGRVWDEVKSQLDNAYGHHVRGINQEMGLIGASIRQLEAKEEELRQELSAWRNQRDPEPERPADSEETRSLLAGMGIPFVPFYAAVEFAPHVPPEMRERIEAALTDMGLLDALVVPAGRLRDIPAEGAYGAVIYPDPQIMTVTLADYLRPALTDGQQITSADIDDVLRTVVVEEITAWPAAAARPSGLPTVAVASGAYRAGVLAGRAPRRQAAIYIGKQARQEYRTRQIVRLEDELKTLALAMERQYEAYTALRTRQDNAAKAYGAFPGEQDIRAIYHEKEAVLAGLGRQEQRVKIIDDRLKKIAGELKLLRDELQASSAGFKLPPDEDAYRTAVSAMNEYQNLLHRLELCRQDLANCRDNAAQCIRRVEELSMEVDALKGEIFTCEDQIERFRLQIAQIELRLKEMGADELREHVRRIAQRLGELPAAVKNLTAEIAKLEITIKSRENRQRELTYKTQLAGQMVKNWQQLLQQELRLGLVYPPDETPDINTILQAKGHLLRQERIDRTSLTERLSKSFAVENNVLMEYRMQLEPLEAVLADTPVLPETSDEDDGLAADWERLRERSRRQVITLDYEGRRQNPYQLYAALARRTEEQKNILSDKDKELYEEVIMNSIGRIISRRIRSAQQWVEEMNKLMRQRNTSSGLRFKLEWKACTAEQDDELDTQDLVRLLHADPAALKASDLDKIARHFQARIERAKQNSEAAADGAGASFQQAVRSILDYRLWFQFKLYYEQAGISWRELSDRVFFKFSGGEKAMAMYIPLFSAAYSRYQEASPDAPYIITLDEAFAGVDENNIRDTFALVEQLNFNYIMNSQALWGDYDVIPALNICELVRPKNAPYVTVVRYHWSGSRRSLQVDDISAAQTLAAATRQEEA